MWESIRPFAEQFQLRKRTPEEENEAAKKKAMAERRGWGGGGGSVSPTSRGDALSPGSSSGGGPSSPASRWERGGVGGTASPSPSSPRSLPPFIPIVPLPIVPTTKPSSSSGLSRRCWRIFGKVRRKLMENQTDGGKSFTFNPELLTTQKRQWHQLHRQLMEKKMRLEPSTFFEHFVVVGLPPTTDTEAIEADFVAKKLADRALARAAAKNGGTDFGLYPPITDPVHEGLEPQILFVYPPCKRIALKELAGFCFPNGVQAQVMEKTPSMSELNEIVYGQPHHNRDDQSFVFLLKVADNVTLYGVCVVVDEILQRPPRVMSLNYKDSPVRAPMSRFLVSAPRCYCILTQMPFFDLHFEVLNCVLAQERLDRITACVNELTLSEQIPSSVGELTSQSEKESSKEGSSGKEIDPMFWMDFAIPVSSVLGAAAAAAGLISNCSVNLKRASTSSSSLGSPSGVLSLWSPKWWGTDSEKDKVDPRHMKHRWAFGSGGAVDGSSEEKDLRSNRRRAEGDVSVGKDKEKRILWIGPRRKDAVHPVDEKEEKTCGSHAYRGSKNVENEATRRVTPSENGSEGEQSDPQTCKDSSTDTSGERTETSVQCAERESHQVQEEKAKDETELTTAEASMSNGKSAGREGHVGLAIGQDTPEESLQNAVAEGRRSGSAQEETVRPSRDACDTSRIAMECASTTNIERSESGGGIAGPVGRSDGGEDSAVAMERCNEQPACVENGPTTIDQRWQEDGAAGVGECLRQPDNNMAQAQCETSAGESREPDSHDKGVGSGAVSAVGSGSTEPCVGISESMAAREGGITASAVPSANGMDRFDDRLSISSPEAAGSPAAATPKMLSSPRPSRGLRSVRSAESLCSTDTYESDEDSAVSDSGASDVDSGAGPAAAAAWAEANGVDSLRIICMYYQQTVPSRGGDMLFWPLEHLQPIRFHRPAMIPPHLVGPKLTDISRCKTKAEILEAQAALMTAEEAIAVAQWSTATLCRSLSVDNILAMLLAVLLEKQMVVICPNLGVLTAVVLSLIPMLRPYTWQSVLLPILPSDLIAFLDAPVPFVVGVQHKTIEVRAKSGNLIRVNVYKDQVKNPHSLPQLPKYRSLAAALQPFHEILASDKEASKRPVNKVTEQQTSAAEGFLQVLRAYLESLCADLPAHAITDVQSSERVSLLLKESFIDSFSYHHRPFIKLFVETQLFAVHTDAVLSSWHG